MGFFVGFPCLLPGMKHGVWSCCFFSFLLFQSGDPGEKSSSSIHSRLCTSFYFVHLQNADSMLILVIPFSAVGCVASALCVVDGVQLNTDEAGY